MPHRRAACKRAARPVYVVGLQAVLPPAENTEERKYVASYKLNIGMVRGCPSAAELATKMEMLPDQDERFAVLDLHHTSTALKCRLVRFTNQVVKGWNDRDREVEEVVVRKAESLPLLILPPKGIVEVQAGSIRSLEQVDVLLSQELGLAVTVEPIIFDVIDLLNRVRQEVQAFQLLSAAVDLFSANSYTLGVYRPKFEDTANGLEFLEQHAEAVKAARIRFAGKTGKVTVTLAPHSAFAFSCREDDADRTSALLRNVACGAGV